MSGPKIRPNTYASTNGWTAIPTIANASTPRSATERGRSAATQPSGTASRSRSSTPPTTIDAVIGSAAPIVWLTGRLADPGGAEAAVADEPPDEPPVLVDDRPVDAERVVGGAEVGVGRVRVRPAGDAQAGRVDRDHLEDEVGQEREQEDHHEPGEQAPDDVRRPSRCHRGG